MSVITRDGASIDGILAEIDGDSVTIETDGDEEKIAFDQIEAMDFGLSPILSLDPAMQVQLIDGSTLIIQSLLIESRKLKIVLACGGEWTVDSKHVDSVRFKTYENQSDLGKQWKEILEDNSRNADAIVINREQALNAVEGIVGDLSDEKLGFSIEARTARVPVSRLDAILFYHASGSKLDRPVCEVTLIDNSRWMARKLTGNRSRIALTSVSGTVAEFPINLIAKVNFAIGNVVSLSSMKPTTNDWQPLITSSAIFEKLRKMKLARVNQSFSGSPLSLKYHTETGLSFQSQTKQFDNGFAIQGGGKLAFALNGQYERLTGEVGFAPDANASGNVMFRVLLDGRIGMERELIHRLMKNPIAIDLDVKDVRRVVFQIEYNDVRSTGDQIHMVDLRVTQ